MNILKILLIIIAIFLYSLSIINSVKIKKEIDNCIGKKVSDIQPEYDKFMKKNIINIVLASLISFVIIIFF